MSFLSSGGGGAPGPARVGTVDENGVLWKATSVGKFKTTPSPQIETVWDVITESAKKFSSVNAVGERPITARTMVDGNEKLTLGPYQFITYAQYLARIERFGSGLSHLGGLSLNDRVVLYADTQLAWMLAAFGCWRQGYVVGTIYATLGEEGALYGINQSECKLVVADGKLLKVLGNLAANASHLKRAITITADTTSSAKKKPIQPSG